MLQMCICTIYLNCLLFQMFNLFDEDGNGPICIDELLNMMAFFIEIGKQFVMVTDPKLQST